MDAISKTDRALKLFKEITTDLCQAEFEALMSRLRLEEFARDMDREKRYEQSIKENNKL